MKKFVELGILFFLLIVVIVAIFTPVGVVIEEFLNIEGGGAGFNYEDSCSIDNVSIKVYGYIYYQLYSYNSK